MLEIRNTLRMLMVLALGTVVSCAAVRKLNLLTTEDEVVIGRPLGKLNGRFVCTTTPWWRLISTVSGRRW